MTAFRLPPVTGPTENPLGCRPGDQEAPMPHSGAGHTTKSRGCSPMSGAAKRPLATSGPTMAGDGGGESSEASEWEDRGREEQLAFLREEEERLGAEG